MPVSPTYPGVYIEEIPSGVHTITGVATSIAAFVGYTTRGPVNEPVHIFSFGDFENACGGLSTDSLVSQTVRHFFQNGGTEAYVVRAASGTGKASTTLRDSVANDVLTVTAAADGTWGNGLQIDVDYDTANPMSMFNLSIAEMVDRNGRLIPARTELYRNLTLNSTDSSYAVDTVNSASRLVTLKAGTIVSSKGSSVGGPLAAANSTALAALGAPRLGLLIDGKGPYMVPVPPAGGAFPAVLATFATALEAAINLAAGWPAVLVTVVGSTLKIESQDTTARSLVHVLNASGPDAAVPLRLGLANGGTEVDGAAGARPVPTGTTGTSTLAFPIAAATGDLVIDVKRGLGTSLRTITLHIWGVAPLPPAPPSLDALAILVEQAMQQAVTGAPPEPYLAGATARRIGNTFRITPGPADPNVSFDISGSAAGPLGLTAAGARNVARYAPGAGILALSQGAVGLGNNGTKPVPADLIGKLSDKSGVYALENVDLFNLLVMPDATDKVNAAILPEAIAYCARRRAMMIIDAPDADFATTQAWIGSGASVLRSRNSAIYYPRLRTPDPLMNNQIASFPAAGAIAGIFARTDAERGVWKAPAGTTANVVGATGQSVALTDAENGTLNPMGLNCLRTFPIHGTVVWGARTGNGADVMADEYKYVPVRRLALFLEESLYRGTQWAVFEPNDEPLWAQIRLNLGAFMHTLYAQGAFQGRTPRDAYFVKCDKETTTQNDIDLGRVNIVVGFAPLKPAEFVIIQIQQIAGAIQA